MAERDRVLTLFRPSLAWAYLSETEDSFAIEREKPSADKAEAFVQLLKQAHQTHYVRLPLAELPDDLPQQ